MSLFTHTTNGENPVIFACYLRVFHNVYGCRTVNRHGLVRRMGGMSLIRIGMVRRDGVESQGIELAEHSTVDRPIFLALCEYIVKSFR